MEALLKSESCIVWGLKVFAYLHGYKTIDTVSRKLLVLFYIITFDNFRDTVFFKKFSNT